MKANELEQFPYSEEIEKYCISALLSDGSLIQYSVLTPLCFYVEIHRDIYRAMQSLHDEGRTVDVVNVLEKMPDRY